MQTDGALVTFLWNRNWQYWSELSD